ncbi:glycoside hydrolase family 57 protein [Edaphobacter albus]|uniref:glycoside hydrolase family 57 protein n=1 Tax=Edaphobacter sp. 4G125 TaxID=2763071 RepID=UPI0016456E70|nr:1,4-alpha-glucan branching protein domain-containing protein [Edaphobacter sp. 4G125]QNI36179.1 DUF1957 domain-containing protein [Edaphobacter sp. 4G125]
MTQASTNSASTKQPKGYLTFTLHAHLPYVVHHGTWPHGMEWLHEAAAETYLPLLRVLRNLERDRIRFQCNLNLSPILLEQLSHPTFIAEFPKYLERKIVAAREDEAFFIQSGESHLAETARFWHRFFAQALEDFRALNGDIVSGFRHFNDIGLIEVITCGATHGFMPLLGTDESVRAQIRTAVKTHKRHMGRHPRGIWAPECGYRPAGFWNYPVGFADGSSAPAGFDRIGVEQALSESDIEFFFVDTHLVEEGHRVPSPYELLNGAVPVDGPTIAMTHGGHRSLYQPYYVDGPYDKRYAATIFPRDPRTGIQVWSGDSGYPGDGVYLDFHKKRWPGGHRYWRVTGPKVDMGDKQPYYPQEAAERVKSHASHFVHLVYEALRSGFNDSIPPILCAPFDAELFGHWWFEGPMWLEAIARTLHDYDTGIQMISCAEYLDLYPRAGFISMPEGSWGAGGHNEVWMNPETSWTYTHIYPAELFTREVASGNLWRDSELGGRIARQLCRELLLLESSDWQFLITTGAARDYAEARFVTHNDQFNEVKLFWQAFESSGQLSSDQEERLTEIERRDDVFPDIDPSLWATSAKQERHQPEATPVVTNSRPMA